VQSLSIVVLLDELFDVRSQVFQVVILVGVDFFSLQRLDEAFAARIGVSRGLRRNVTVKNDDFALFIPIIRGVDMNLN